jgi:hypothetical protein
LVDELAKPDEAFRTGAVEAPRAVAALMQQPGVPEHAEVLRNGWSRDVETGGDLARAQLPVTYEGEYLPPPRLGDCARDVVHVGLRGHRGELVKHLLT